MFDIEEILEDMEKEILNKIEQEKHKKAKQRKETICLLIFAIALFVALFLMKSYELDKISTIKFIILIAIDTLMLFLTTKNLGGGQGG